MELHFLPVLQRLDYLLSGLGITFGVSLATLAASLVLGIGLALGRTARTRVVRWLSVAYIDVFRNTPFLVQLFFFYYGLAEIGIDIDPVVTGILALSLATATHNGEALRAGIEGVDRGVVEAARALALSDWQIQRHIILPLAFRTALRPMGSVFINMVLTTSILSTITVNDLMGNAMTVAGETFRPFEVYLVLLLLYCLLTFSLSGVLNLVHARVMTRGRRQVTVR